jgi:hypothetical protein
VFVLAAGIAQGLGVWVRRLMAERAVFIPQLCCVMLLPFVLSVLGTEGRDLGSNEESVCEFSCATTEGGGQAGLSCDTTEGSGQAGLSCATTEGGGQAGLSCAREDMPVVEFADFLTVGCDVF